VAVTVSVTPGAGGFTVSVALRVVPPEEPEMLTAVGALTEPVATVKVALVAPAATVTLGGAVAAAALVDSDTTAPPAGAALHSVAEPPLASAMTDGLHAGDVTVCAWATRPTPARATSPRSGAGRGPPRP
jgi:hypothetical protein